MNRLYVVRPSAAGWAIASEGLWLEFESGARAEATARRLAQADAEAGTCAEVRIVLRDGAIAGVSIYQKSAVLVPTA